MIQRLHRAKHSAAAIARRLMRHRTTVSKYIGKTEVPKYKRRPIATIIARRAVVLETAKLEKTVGHQRRKLYPSPKSIAQHLASTTTMAISAAQVKGDLKALGFKAYVRPIRTTTKPQEREVRRAYARKMLKKGSAYVNRRIAFSDETIVTANDHSSRFQHALNKDDVHPRDRKSNYNVSSCCVWAAVGIGWRSAVVVLPQRMVNKEGEDRPYRLDSTKYINKCLSPNVPHLLRNNFVFMHDGASCHTSAQTKSFLSRKGVIVIPDHPPYSPDLNMIEGLWKELKVRVSDYPCDTVPQLTQAIKLAWESIPQRVIDAYVGRMSSALHNVAKSG